MKKYHKIVAGSMIFAILGMFVALYQIQSEDDTATEYTVYEFLLPRLQENLLHFFIPTLGIIDLNYQYFLYSSLYVVSKSNTPQQADGASNFQRSKLRGICPCKLPIRAK